MADWDGLRTCAVCGDYETQGVVCWRCVQQLRIDGDDLHYYEVVLEQNGKIDTLVRTATSRYDIERQLRARDANVVIKGIYQLY